MNKKGEEVLLVTKTAEIIIGVRVLVFLAFLIYSIWNNNRTIDKNLELAKYSLNRLEKDLKAGASETQILNPRSSGKDGGWALISWPDPYGNVIETCREKGWKGCICLCLANTLMSCDETNVCIESEFHVDSGNDYSTSSVSLPRAIFILPPLNLEINQTTKIIKEKK
jgi:hypothetical protein